MNLPVLVAGAVVGAGGEGLIRQLFIQRGLGAKIS